MTQRLFRDALVKNGAIDRFDRFNKRYFQLEILGDEYLPSFTQGNVMFVMNHTAFFGLEVALLMAHLLHKDPEHDFRILAWRGFVNGLLGPWFRRMGCQEATIKNGIDLLARGKSVLIMPEGVGATDVRNTFNHFHTGYLRMLKEVPVPIVPIGFYGVDQANPWLVYSHPSLSKLWERAIGQPFDFLLAPKFPVFRPVKVVLNVGKPIHFQTEDLANEAALQASNQRIRSTIIELVNGAEKYRTTRINDSRANQLLHRFLDGEHTLM